MKTKILQTIIEDGDILYVFTENPKEDINEFIDMYGNEESIFHLGYDRPALATYKFLGNIYKCIMLWYDNCEEECYGTKSKLDNLINNLLKIG